MRRKMSANAMNPFLPPTNEAQHVRVWEAVHTLMVDRSIKGVPDLGGFEVLRRIRAKSQLPVLMLTARGEDLDG